MLEQIISSKYQELEERRSRIPESQLQIDIDDLPLPPPFRRALTGPGFNVIAEIKYQSPSRGRFSCRRPPEEIARGYVEAGAAAISILTDERWFGGSPEHLCRVRQWILEVSGEGSTRTPVPLLRKDFVISRYQLLEARAWGASSALLIAACLETGPLQDLLKWAVDLELDPLVEIHDLFELDRAMEAGATLIGVNNRNLRTFQVSLGTSFDIARKLEGESGLVLVAESGISDRSQLAELRDAGYSAFLIGSAFMNSEDPGAALLDLLHTPASNHSNSPPDPGTIH